MVYPNSCFGISPFLVKSHGSICFSGYIPYRRIKPPGLPPVFVGKIPTTKQQESPWPAARACKAFAAVARLQSSSIATLVPALGTGAMLVMVVVEGVVPPVIESYRLDRYKYI